MGDVRRDEVRRLRQVARDPAVVREREMVGRVLRLHRGDAVVQRTHAANALGDVLGIQRIAAPQKILKSAKHLAGHKSPGDLAVLDVHLDAEMAFDARDRTQSNRLAHNVVATKLIRPAAGTF